MAVRNHGAFRTHISTNPVWNPTINPGGIEVLANNADLRLIAVANVPLDNLSAIYIDGAIDLNAVTL